jgi:hypothetical protein
MAALKKSLGARTGKRSDHDKSERPPSERRERAHCYLHNRKKREEKACSSVGEWPKPPPANITRSAFTAGTIYLSSIQNDAAPCQKLPLDDRVGPSKPHADGSVARPGKWRPFRCSEAAPISRQGFNPRPGEGCHRVSLERMIGQSPRTQGTKVP